MCEIGAEVVAIGALLAPGESIPSLRRSTAWPSNSWNAFRVIYAARGMSAQRCRNRARVSRAAPSTLGIPAEST